MGRRLPVETLLVERVCTRITKDNISTLPHRQTVVIYDKHFNYRVPLLHRDYDQRRYVQSTKTFFQP